jgi:hypothetical protein
MSQHTPGPWRKCGGYTAKYTAIYSDEFGYIVRGFADYMDDKENGEPTKAPGFETQQANARLIAAAPDLLAALKAVEWVESDGLSSCPCCRYVKPIGAAGEHPETCTLSAAIRKAEGRLS